MGKNVANELYELSQNNKYNNFLDLLNDISQKTSINKSMLDILIKLNYFKDFANIGKILKFVQYYNLLQGKKSPKKKTIIENIKVISIIEKNSVPTKATYTKFNSMECLKEIWSVLPNKNISFKENLINNKELLGYINYKNNKLNKRYVFVSEINLKYTPVINTYCLNNSSTCKCKISKRIWNNQPIQENDIIYIDSMKKKFGCKKIGEKTDKRGNIKPIFEEDKTKLVWWIEKYSIINNMEEVLNNIE